MRSKLKNVIKQAASKGYEIKIGFEVEFELRDLELKTCVETANYCSSYSIDMLADFFDDITDNL